MEKRDDEGRRITSVEEMQKINTDGETLTGMKLWSIVA